MRCDEPDGRQRDCTIFKRSEDGREALRRTGYLDTVVGSALGEL
jgi:hypothetical protein